MLKKHLQMCAEEFIPANFDAPRLHVVEHASGHFVLKRLLRGDARLNELGVSATLAGALLGRLPLAQMAAWTACNRGCFLLTV